MSELFTVAEAAKFANVSSGTVYRHLLLGNLSGKRVPNTNPNPKSSQPFTWVVDKQSILDYYYGVVAGKKQHTFKRPENASPTKVRWVNVYPKGEIDSYLFMSKKEAIANADVDVVATKAVQIAL